MQYVSLIRLQWAYQRACLSYDAATDTDLTVFLFPVMGLFLNDLATLSAEVGTESAVMVHHTISCIDEHFRILVEYYIAMNEV